MSHYAKLAVSSPINRTAGVVTSGSAGMQPVGPKHIDHHHRWDTPPATVRLRADQENLTGIAFGRFVVVGYLGKLNPKKDGRWLVRCRCSAYEARSAKSIRNPANGVDACRECRHHEYLKRRDREIGSGATRSVRA